MQNVKVVQLSQFGQKIDTFGSLRFNAKVVRLVTMSGFTRLTRSIRHYQIGVPDWSKVDLVSQATHFQWPHVLFVEPKPVVKTCTNVYIDVHCKCPLERGLLAEV